MSESCLPIRKDLRFYIYDERMIKLRLVDVITKQPVNISKYTKALFTLKNKPVIAIPTHTSIDGVIDQVNGWITFTLTDVILKSIRTGSEDEELIELYGSIYLTNDAGSRLTYLEGLHSFIGGPQNV